MRLPYKVGRGYSPIKDIYVCGCNALELDDSPEMENEAIRSILFPLMGSGTTRLSPQEVADQLIDMALSYLEDCPESRVNEVYFLAYNDRDLDLCKHKFINDLRIKNPKDTL